MFNGKKVLQVKDLTKWYQSKDSQGNKIRFKAVNSISFCLNKGEILGLLGPNGAGKTTTIQMLLSVLTPSSGDIVYFGQDLNSHRSEILQNVSFASTYINLPWRLTIKENLLVYGKLYELSREQIMDRMQRFLDFFGIGSYINKIMSSLSAGQLTRVMLVKAFLAYPKNSFIR